MKNLKNYIILLISLSLILYFFYQFSYSRGYNQRQLEEREIIITDFDTLQVIQDARLNWYPQSVLDSILDTEYWNIKVQWVDKLRVKDSINIKDSITFYPFYSSDTSFTIFNQDEFQNKIMIALSLNQGFLPYQEKFVSKVVVDSVRFNLQIVEKELEYDSYRVSIMGGVKNRFGKDPLLFTGGEYNVFDYRYLQFYIGGEGTYNINTKMWDTEMQLGMRLKL